jgi:hypothetical protein
MNDVKILNRRTRRQAGMAVLVAFVLFGLSFTLSSCEEDNNVKGKGETSAKEVTQKDEKSSPTPTPANNESSSSSTSDTVSSLGKDSQTPTSLPSQDKSISSGASDKTDESTITSKKVKSSRSGKIKRKSIGIKKNGKAKPRKALKQPKSPKLPKSKKQSEN